MKAKLSSLMRLCLCSLFILAITAAGISSSRAQNLADIPPPKPPLVAKVPDSANWTITPKSTAATSAPKPTPQGASRFAGGRIVEVRSTKSGKLRRDVIVYSDGITTTHWLVDQLLLWTTPQGQVSASDLSAAEPMDPENPEPAAAGGFPGTRWLQISYYDKVIAVEKHPCYHYVHGDSEAWIDAETNLPVAYKSKNIVYSYKFGDPPAEPLILPPEFQKIYDKVQQLSIRKKLLEGGAVTHR